ncbi:hypothetical protein D3C71_2182390 [compost metagenome]
MDLAEGRNDLALRFAQLAISLAYIEQYLQGFVVVAVKKVEGVPGRLLVNRH